MRGTQSQVGPLHDTKTLALTATTMQPLVPLFWLGLQATSSYLQASIQMSQALQLQRLVLLTTKLKCDHPGLNPHGSPRRTKGTPIFWGYILQPPRAHRAEQKTLPSLWKVFFTSPKYRKKTRAFFYDNPCHMGAKKPYFSQKQRASTAILQLKNFEVICNE